MAVFHYLHVRAFAHETEDPERVRAALRHAAQGDVALQETAADGSHGNRILILEGELKSAPAQKAVFRRLREDDPDGFERLRSQARERVDEHLNFHLRLDKQEAYAGRLRLAQDDDAITLRAKIRSFQSKRSAAGMEDALQQLEGFLQACGDAGQAPLDGAARTFKNKRTM